MSQDNEIQDANVPLTIQKVCERVTRDSLSRAVGITAYYDHLYVITEDGDLYRVHLADFQR